MKREIWMEGDVCAVTEDGHLVEWRMADAAQSGAEAICLGRVIRVVKGMEAAFVDIGQEKNGFLPLKERSLTFTGQPLREGDRVPVQVRREAHGEKGAFLTRDISLCGEYLLLMPYNRYIGVSAKITDEERRTELKALGEALTGGEMGLVMRTSTEHAAADAIAAEWEALTAQWVQLTAALPTAHAPSVVYRPRTVAQSVLDDYRHRGIDCVHVSTEEEEILFPADVPCRVDGAGLLEKAGLTAQRDKALRRRVWLPGGGNLVIDPCEALTVIDVNTAKYAGRQTLRQTILETNTEAVAEAARQIRLRNLSGIILIDLIDMDAEEDRRLIQQRLEAACAADQIKTVVHGYTSLGLMEMTRRRAGRTLAERLREAGVERDG